MMARASAPRTFTGARLSPTSRTNFAARNADRCGSGSQQCRICDQGIRDETGMTEADTGKLSVELCYQKACECRAIAGDDSARLPHRYVRHRGVAVVWICSCFRNYARSSRRGSLLYPALPKERARRVVTNPALTTALLLGDSIRPRRSALAASDRHLLFLASQCCK
jgi:hypothetical protein